MMTGDWCGSPTAAGAVIDHLWIKTIACLRGRGLKTVQQLVLWLVVARNTIACLKTGDWQQSNSNVLWLIEISERVRDKKYNRLSRRQGTGVQQLPLAVIVGTTLGLAPDCCWLVGHCHHLTVMLPDTTWFSQLSNNAMRFLMSEITQPYTKCYNRICYQSNYERIAYSWPNHGS